MSQRELKKCSYSNSGFYQYTKKENECKKSQPIEECKVEGCKPKECPGRNPKSANLLMNADLEQFAPIPMLRSQQLMKIKYNFQMTYGFLKQK